MTQFEYISVAVSLVLALAVSDLLRAIVPALRPQVRYWPHAAWLFAMVLLIAYTWLALWNLNLRGVSWHGLSLIYILVNPALLTIMARLLTDSNASSMDSFRGLFRANRRPFYTVALVYSLNGFFTAWVLGSVPLGAVTPVQVGALLASALFVTGIVAQSERADAVIATIALLGVLVALATLPILASVQPGT